MEEAAITVRAYAPPADVPDPFLSLPEWHLKAKCRGTDPDLFFPGRGGSTRPARALCAACPVQAECLEYALLLRPKALGIWGGTTERDRRRLRKERAA